MAKSRRKMTKSPRAARKRGDWVYRSNIMDEEGGTLEALGSYTGNENTLAVGPGAAQVRVLYDSGNRFQEQTHGGFLVGVGRAGRAEGRKALCLKTVGQLIVRPSVWALGNVWRLGLRIAVFEQDAETGAALLDAPYTMFAEVDGGHSTAQYANQRRINLWERRYRTQFGDNGIGHRVIDVAASFRVALSGHEALYIYAELESGSVAVVNQYWFKTLVVDEG